MSKSYYDDLFIEDYKFPPVLTANETKELLIKYKNGDLNAKDKLVNHNIRLVFYRVMGRFNNLPVDKDELVCIGNMGLFKAVETFDISKLTTFASYATSCIDNEILMYFRKIKKHNDVQSLNTVINTDKDGSEQTLEGLISSDEDIEENTIENDNKRIIREIVEKLPGRDKKIIQMYFGFNDDKEYNQEEIADELKISQSYISRIIKRILKKIKYTMENYDAIASEERIWNLAYKEVKNHFLKYKNLDIPDNYTFIINNKKYYLKAWLNEQIMLYENNKLRIERFILLADFNISWDVDNFSKKINYKTKQWLINYEIAKDYYVNNKNLFIPRRYKTVINNKKYNVGLWIDTQRKKYKSNLLSEEQIKLLNKIEMIWDLEKVREQTWLEKYELLKEYYEENDNSFPPAGYIVENETGFHKLGLWFQNQKQEYKKGILKQERIELLNFLDENWCKPKIRKDTETWEFYYELAKEYYKRYGHLLIPNMYEVEKNGKKYKLGIWIKIQRQSFLGTFVNHISKYRIKLLEEIGMIWKVWEYAQINGSIIWFDKYNLLRDYYNENGHIDLENNYEVIVNGETINIGLWLEKQKEIYNGIIDGSLSDTQIKLLNEICIGWSNLKPIIKEEKIPKKWLENYEIAKEYFEEHGNIVMQPTYTVEKDGKIYNIGKWVQSQQRVRSGKKPGNLSSKQIKMLDEIGMIWDRSSKEFIDIRKEQIYNVWLEIYKYAKEYYNKNGNLFIQKGYSVGEGDKTIDLGTWIYTQRKLYWENKLSRDKIKLLEEIGMIFDSKSSEYKIAKQEIITEMWLKMYKYAKIYYNEYGNLHVPQCFIIIDGDKVISLGNWISVQRQYFKENKLSEAKIKFLEDIKMIWSINEYKRTVMYKDADSDDLNKNKYNVDNDEVYLQLYCLSKLPAFEQVLLDIDQNMARILLLKLNNPKKDINQLCMYIGMSKVKLKEEIEKTIYELKEKIEEIEVNMYLDDYDGYEYYLKKDNV